MPRPVSRGIVEASRRRALNMSLRWMGRSSLIGCAALLMGAPTGATMAAVRPQPAAVIVSSARTSDRVVALTFDDGPSPYTPRVLALLHSVDAHATFFVVGLHVTQYPSFVKAETLSGNLVGNHTYSHVDLEILANAAVLEQLAATQSAVHSAAGVTPRWFRPPYGAVDARVAELASSLGLQTVLWSVDPQDWLRPGVDAIAQRVLAQVRPGSVVLFHDGGGDRSETVAALSVVLSSLRAHGYRFLTLDELFYPRRSSSAKPLPAPKRHKSGHRRKPHGSGGHS